MFLSYSVQFLLNTQLLAPDSYLKANYKQHNILIVQHHCSTVQCLFIKKPSPGLSYSNRQVPNWAHKQISMGRLCSESYPYPTPRRTWYCPPCASGGSTEQKGWLLSSCCCRCTPKAAQSVFMLVCFVNSLFLITANSSPCYLFWNSVLKNHVTLILTDSKDKHTYPVYYLYYNCSDSFFKPFPLNLSKHELTRRLSRYGRICSPAATHIK